MKRPGILLFLKSETELNEAEDWLETTSDDCSDRNITNEYVHLQIHHFTRWSVTGIIREVKDYWSSTKKIRLVVYSPTRDNAHNVFKVYVRCLDDYPENIQVSRPSLQYTAHVINRPLLHLNIAYIVSSSLLQLNTAHIASRHSCWAQCY